MTNRILVRNPWSGAIDAEIDEPDSDWLSSECSRLRAAQGDWASRSVAERVEVLTAFGSALHDHRDAIVASLEDDTGRTRIAALEFDLAIQAIARCCALAPAAVAERASLDTGRPDISARQQQVPYGLALNIAPWNFPLLLSLIDVFPALAVGNAAIVKPSEVTPRWVEPVREVVAGIPALDAVLGFAVGTGRTGAELIGHADIVSFTGSVATGRKVAEAAARHFIPALLELGGNDPAIVLRSADIDATADKICWSATTSSGQACQSLERVYVDDAIADAFIEAVTKRARTITVNYPDRADGFIGPFIFDQQPGKIIAQLDDAVAKGAKILTGGELIEHGGTWMEATVLTNVNHDMQIMTEETFGPVIPIMRFETVGEAVRLANDTHYGLSASVFAGSIDEGVEVARRIDAGAVSINDASLTAHVHSVPHESFKFSGLGRSRFGDEALLRFLRTKAIFEQHGETQP